MYLMSVICKLRLRTVRPLALGVIFVLAAALPQLRATETAADLTTPLASKKAAGSDAKAPVRTAPPSTPSLPPTIGADADQTANPDNSNPYAIIVDRNVFRLVPPPPPPEAPKPPIDVPTVNLSGFRKTAKDIWVYLAMKPKDPKESWIYFSMREGEKAGKEPNTLELVKIHADAEIVDIVNSGQPMSLSLKSNSFQSASSGGASAKPGDNLGRRRMGAIPPAAPPAMPAVRYTPALKTGPTAVGLSGDNTGVVAGAQNIPQAGYNYQQPQSYGGGTQVAGAQQMNVAAPNGAAMDLNPSVPSRSAQAQANWPPQVQASPEQQAINLMAHEAAGGPPAPPIPGVNADEPPAGNAQVPVIPRYR